MFLTAYRGDLRIDTPQSVFALDKSELSALGGGRSLRLAPGDTVELPDDAGSVTLEKAIRFASLQVAYDPGKEIALASALMLLIGLTMSLTIPPPMVARIRPARDGDVAVEIGGLSLTERELPRRDLAHFDTFAVDLRHEEHHRPTEQVIR